MNTFRLLSFLLLPLAVSAGAATPSAEVDPAAQITANLSDQFSREALREKLAPASKEFADAVLTLDLRLPSVTTVHSEAETESTAADTRKIVEQIISLTAPVSDPAVRLSAQRKLASFTILSEPLPSGKLPAALDLVELHVPALSRYMIHLFSPEIWEPLRVTVDGHRTTRRMTDHLELRDAVWLADVITQWIDKFNDTEEFGSFEFGDPAETVPRVMKAFCVSLGVPVRRPLAKMTSDRLRAWAIARCDKALMSRQLGEADRAIVVEARTKITDFKTSLFQAPVKPEFP